jgi:hypothetical protein
LRSPPRSSLLLSQSFNIQDGYDLRCDVARWLEMVKAAKALIEYNMTNQSCSGYLFMTWGVKKGTLMSVTLSSQA